MQVQVLAWFFIFCLLQWPRQFKAGLAPPSRELFFMIHAMKIKAFFFLLSIRYKPLTLW